jgi:hypothetical protein
MMKYMILMIQIALGFAVLANLACLVIIILTRREIEKLKQSENADRMDIDGIIPYIDKGTAKNKKLREYLDQMAASDLKDNPNEMHSVSISESANAEQEVRKEQCFTLYANASADSSGTFGTVNEEPTGKSIFMLFLDHDMPTRATFNVYPGAVSRVLEDANFLDYVCQIEEVGNRSRLVVIEDGTAENVGDKWKMVNKLRVKFE